MLSESQSDINRFRPKAYKQQSDFWLLVLRILNFYIFSAFVLRVSFRGARCEVNSLALAMMHSSR